MRIKAILTPMANVRREWTMSWDPMIDLAQKVRFLSDPGAYPHATTSVEARETHMSWVFLTDDCVYKLKKPVKYPFLDFSTLHRRRFFCEEELRLNRRLANEIYRAVVPLRCDRTGRLNFSDRGRVVDWLVEMKRLPLADMLDARLDRGIATREDVRRIGERMAGFYAACAPQITESSLYLKHLADEQAINRAVLEQPELGVCDVARPVLDALDQALATLAPKIKLRIIDGRIVEGHGDLRPEHVHLGEPVQIIDCLEFSRPMRMVDPYDEINYLGLECAMLGAPWIRPVLLDMLGARLGDQPDEDIMAFYGGFRLVLRARLCMAHLLDPLVHHAERWKPMAISYIALAKRELSPQCRADPRSIHSREDV